MRSSPARSMLSTICVISTGVTAVPIPPETAITPYARSWGSSRRQANFTIEKINRGDIEAFIEGEQDRGLKLSTVKTRLQILKTFVRYLNEEKIIDHDVFPWKMTIKPPQILPRAMDPDEVKRLLSEKKGTYIIL